MSTFELSVVLTTHERPQLLSRALESLLNQTNTNFQIILCSDEGSHDTKDIARKFLRNFDSLLILPHLKGPSSTRNEGIRNATSNNIIFLDDDDSFEVNYFENLIKAVEGQPNSLFYCNYTKYEEQRGNFETTVSSSTKISQKNNPTNILVGNFIPNNSFVINSLVAKSVLFDAKLSSHEDWDYLIELSKFLSFVHLDMYGPNIHIADIASRNLDSHKNGEVALDFLSIYRKHLTSDPQVKKARQLQMQAFGINVPFELL
jgi:glycosyltransferase involved in cell wall biosynthesis